MHDIVAVEIFYFIIVLLVQIQIALDFDEYIVAPFFTMLTKVFPQAEMFLENLKQNREEWKKLQSETPIASIKFPKSKRVSFSSGTLLIPDFWLDDDRRHSADCSKVFLDYKKRPTSYVIKRKREGCSPDKMNILNNLLKSTLVNEEFEIS